MLRPPTPSLPCLRPERRGRDMPSDEDRIYDLNAQLKDARAKGNMVGEKVITAQLNSLLDRYPHKEA